MSAETSSTVETTGAAAPALRVLTAGRETVLVTCTTRAITAPVATGIQACEERNASGSVTVAVCPPRSIPAIWAVAEEPKTMPPAVGRTKVCSRSLKESTTGTLSATTSTASSTARTVRTHPFDSQAKPGPRSTTSVQRSSRPSTTSGM